MNFKCFRSAIIAICDVLFPSMVVMTSIFALPAHGANGAGTDEAKPKFIEFGVSATQWERNRRCDDPRFMDAPERADSRMSSTLDPEALYQDADDCRAAFEVQHIIPRMKFGDVNFAEEPQYTEGGGSKFRHIGECSDPRLEGPGIRAKVGRSIEGDHPFPHACRVPFLSRAAILKAKTSDGPFFFGHDGGKFTFDGECDDPRFEGPGMASPTTRLNVGRDATDCDQGEVTPTEIRSDISIDFGNNASRFSYDGECDDPRFEGPGMADPVSTADEGKDAIDCFRAYDAGKIELAGQE